MALRGIRRQLRERGPDAAQHPLPSPNPGSDGHHRPGGLSPGPEPDLLQAAGAQRGDPGHDPPRPGLPGRHDLPPRLQRLRDQPLTGPQEPSSSPASPICSDSPKSSSLSVMSACFSSGTTANTHPAPPPSCGAAASTALPHPEPKPSLGNDPNLPLLSSLSLLDPFSLNTSRQRDLLLPHTRQPRRAYLKENSSFYCPFPSFSPHISTSSRNSLPTVASEPTLLSHATVTPQGSHLPRFPGSLYKHPNTPSVLQPAPPSAPGPRPAGPGQAAAWACCCSLSGEATPLWRYLGKVGQAALPLLKAGGLLNTEPSDIQTWDVEMFVNPNAWNDLINRQISWSEEETRPLTDTTDLWETMTRCDFNPSTTFTLQPRVVKTLRSC